MSHHFLVQIKVSSAVLKAAAHHYGAQCDKPNKEFMLCRWEEKDPRKCLEEGRKVNDCALNFFRYLPFRLSRRAWATEVTLSGRCYYFFFFLMCRLVDIKATVLSSAKLSAVLVVSV